MDGCATGGGVDAYAEVYSTRKTIGYQDVLLFIVRM